MSELSCTAKLSELSDEHYNQQISFEEYREQRRKILDELDAELNVVEVDSARNSTRTSLLSKAVAFFKNNGLSEN